MVSRLGKEQRPAGVPPDAMSSGSQANVQSSVSMQRIYTIVLELRASLPGIDNRFTHFQAPVRVEDAWAEFFPFLRSAVLKGLMLRLRRDSKKVLTRQKSWRETLRSSTPRTLISYSLSLAATHLCPECRSTWRLCSKRSLPRVKNAPNAPNLSSSRVLLVEVGF